MSNQEKQSWNMKAFLREVEQLLERLEESDVTEVAWEGKTCGVKIRRKRNGTRFHVLAREQEEPEMLPPKNLLRVTSPVVGIFHFPGEKPLEETAVRDGKTLGYVEAIDMKHDLELSNPGRIFSTHVEEGQAVGFGQLLFTLEASD